MTNKENIEITLECIERDLKDIQEGLEKIKTFTEEQDENSEELFELDYQLQDEVDTARAIDNLNDILFNLGLKDKYSYTYGKYSKR